MQAESDYGGLLGIREMGSIKNSFDLTGKNAPITGASRGLGLQIAKALGERGGETYHLFSKPADLERAQSHLAAQGIKADRIRG